MSDSKPYPSVTPIKNGDRIAFVCGDQRIEGTAQVESGPLAREQNIRTLRGWSTPVLPNLNLRPRSSEPYRAHPQHHHHGQTTRPVSVAPRKPATTGE
nr:MAG TPA: hypothetical protein [Caudoviricetes sp.]